MGWTNSFQNQADGGGGGGVVGERIVDKLFKKNQADFNRKHRLHP